jgi:gas vesicle protein
MSENSGSDVGAFLAGFIIGGLVGAAAALILAPQSGEEMREKLAAQSAELRERSVERAHEYRDRAGHAVADARQAAQDQATRVQEQSRIILDQGKARISGARAEGEVNAQGNESAPEEGSSAQASDDGDLPG